jgi:ribosome maturation factor RimP
VEPLLDEADPIEGSYTFEVSSAGAERALKRPPGFRAVSGQPVSVRLYKAQDGRKEFAGILKAYEPVGRQRHRDGGRPGHGLPRPK